MDATRPVGEARLRRLAEELAEIGFGLDLEFPRERLVRVEIAYALRPRAHERRVSSVGSIIEPRAAPFRWEHATQLQVTRRPVGPTSLAGARLFADGLSSWLIRRVDGDDEWAVFDRPAGSERDLVVLAEALAGTLVQRHPAGSVRVVGRAFGVLRWDGLDWHHEPPLRSWIDSVAGGPAEGRDRAPGVERDVLAALLAFAVHDLGSRGIGATLVYRPAGAPGTGVQAMLPPPPPLQIRRPVDLAPLRHALAQIDGAALFDASGTLRQLGARLVPTADAEGVVESYRGMRHTSARRYSFDDPAATVIVVSEDGPVTVLRGGELVGRSPVGGPEDERLHGRPWMLDLE
jgi:hypothetical protein